VSAHLVPPIRELLGQHPRAARRSPEQVAGLLWILCYVSAEEDAPPGPYEVADALEVIAAELERLRLLREYELRARVQEVEGDLWVEPDER
jgi:hypothetical protein